MNNPASEPSKLSHYLIFFSVILIWGMGWPITKLGLHYIPPIYYAAYRILIGTVILFSVLGATKKLIFPRRSDLPHIFSVGFLLVALFQILSTFGLFYVSAGRSTILVYTTQIWVIPIAYFLFHEHVNKFHILSMIFGLIGISLLFSPLGINWHDKNALLGNSILLLAALVWAINIVISRYVKWHSTPMQLMPWQLLVGVIPIFICAFIFHPHPIIHWTKPLIGSLLFTGILGTAYGLWGMVVASKELPPTTTSLATLAIPVIGIISSQIVLNEKISLIMVMAMSLIFAGLLIIILAHRRKLQQNKI